MRQQGLGWRRQWGLFGADSGARSAPTVGLGWRRQWGSVSAESGAQSAPTEGLVAEPTEGLVSAPAEIANVYLHTKSLIKKKLTKCSTEI